MCFFVCIISYRRLMEFQHVDPLEAVKIHEDIRSNFSLGIHWGTFNLSYEVSAVILNVIMSKLNWPHSGQSCLLLQNFNSSSHNTWVTKSFFLLTLGQGFGSASQYVMSFCLFVKKPFICKCMLYLHSFSHKPNSFSEEKICVRWKGKSEMAYWTHTSKLYIFTLYSFVWPLKSELIS